MVALGAVSLVTACGISIGSVEPPEFAELPEELAKDCVGPVRIPDEDLPERDLVPFWAQDRINLSNCVDLHGQTVDWIEQRDTGIRNE